MICGIETFGRVVGAFCERKKEWVRQMGFESLLHLQGKNLPRMLCYWLMTRVDPTTRTFIALNGDRFPEIDKKAVYWLLGIQCEGHVLPKKSDVNKEEVDIFKDKYSTLSGGTKVITGNSLLSVVESDSSDQSEFKKAFLMWTLCSILCPNTCKRLSKKLYHLVTVAESATDYDWCSLVLDTLMDNVKIFAESFYSSGHSNGVGGCTYILAIYYLDRLIRPPLEWNSFPRIQVCTKIQIKNALFGDRLKKGGDFGAIGCVCVSYGKPHPYISTDVMPSTQMSSILSVADEEVCEPIKPRRKATSVYNPRDRWEQAQARKRGTSSSSERSEGDEQTSAVLVQRKSSRKRKAAILKDGERRRKRRAKIPKGHVESCTSSMTTEDEVDEEGGGHESDVPQVQWSPTTAELETNVSNNVKESHTFEEQKYNEYVWEQSAEEVDLVELARTRPLQVYRRRGQV